LAEHGTASTATIKAMREKLIFSISICVRSLPATSAERQTTDHLQSSTNISRARVEGKNEVWLRRFRVPFGLYGSCGGQP
jgi:hypothetical protein